MSVRIDLGNGAELGFGDGIVWDDDWEYMGAEISPEQRKKKKVRRKMARKSRRINRKK